MRVTIVILAVLTIFLGSCYVLVFTQPGNNLVKPYLQSYVSKKIKKDVKIEKLTLSLSHFSLQAKVPNEASLLVDGDINLFKLGFDLIYQIQAQNLKTPVVVIKDRLELSGLVKGVVDDLRVNGQGKAFSSNLKYNVHVVDKIPTTGNIDAKGINVGQILDLIGKKRYLTGFVDIDADVKNVKNSISGNVDIFLKNAKLRKNPIKKDFNVALPYDVDLVGKINGDIQNNSLHAKSSIVSSLLRIYANNTNVNLADFSAKSDVHLSIENLEKLHTITQKKLYGSLAIDANVKKDKNGISADANSNIFGGRFDATLKNNQLQAKGKNFKLKKILDLIGEPAYAYGDMRFDLVVDDITKKDKVAKVDMDIKNGEFVGSIMRNKFKMNFPPVTNFNLNANGDLNKNIANATARINSDLASISKFKGTYDLAKNELKSTYTASVKDLRKLAFITKQKLHGSLNANGVINYKNKNLYATANAPLLGGESKSVFDKGVLNVNADQISIKGLCKLLGYPYVFNSKGDFTLKYDTKDKQGAYKLFMKNGHVVENRLSKLLKTFTAYDMTKDAFKNTTLKGVINDDKATYILDLTAHDTSLKIPNGKLNLTTQMTSADYAFKFQKTTINGKIKGEINSPKVTASSKYLKNKAVKAIEKQIDKRLGGKKKEVIKDLLKMF